LFIMNPVGLTPKAVEGALPPFERSVHISHYALPLGVHPPLV
jgi:hypothetical protein